MQESKECRCTTVKRYENEWQCLLCGKRFIPIDACEKCAYTESNEQGEAEPLGEDDENI